MDEKISWEAISLYSDAYAGKMLKDFFRSKDVISGQEILSLCSIQQVNLFVVRELFKSWKEETTKLKSFYFDYEHPEVKSALEDFMGILSQHIVIDETHFTPLLKKAVNHTLLVVFDPYDFFSMLISGKHNRLDVVSFREEIKYLKVNKAPLEKLLQRLDEKNIKDIPGNEAFAILDQILEEVNFTPEDIDDYIEKFSVVNPLDPNKFYVKKEVETLKFPARPEVTPEPRVTLPKATNVVRQPSQPPSTHTGLNAPPRSRPTGFKQIGKIKDSLTINQKFMFTKVLFHGDFELFSKAIEDLDRFENIKNAMNYLEENYGDWDQESEEFHEFMELVESRFN
jgi:hypothetical protein